MLAKGGDRMMPLRTMIVEPPPSGHLLHTSAPLDLRRNTNGRIFEILKIQTRTSFGIETSSRFRWTRLVSLGQGPGALVLTKLYPGDRIKSPALI